MKLWQRCLASLSLCGVALAAQSCAAPAPVQLHGQVHLTILHTADIHSRLFPYNLQIGTIDAQLGLGPYDAVVQVGGAAKVSHILGRERARSERVLHIDGGDCFQGAPIFNFFGGEAEMRAMTEMGTDVMVIANHEFDRGAFNVGDKIENFADFPVLAANYRLGNPNFPGDTELSRVLTPWTSFNVDGLRVGVVGMANFSTLSALFETPNNLGITLLNTQQVAQFYIDLLRPLVDVIVFDTHLGREYDEEMIAQTSGIDIVLGSHNHIVLQPPKQIDDCQNTDVDENGNLYHYINVVSGEPQDDNAAPAYTRRRCNPRKVILAHSGAFAQFVGRLDLLLSNDKNDLPSTYDPIDGFEVLSNDYTLIPVTEDVPEDPHVRAILAPYKTKLDALIDLDLLVGYSPAQVKRSAPAGGDSPLGNMVATSIWLRQGIQTDFALTNTTGVRADLVPGPVTIEELYNVFPFDNSISKMNLSGVEIQEMFDFAARRSASRGCVSQVQIAGARVVMNCVPGCDRADLTPPCVTDDDCPFQGSCDFAAHKCKPQPCAEHIYIGRDETRKCKFDVDCGRDDKNQPLLGSCDNFIPDADGYGRCMTEVDPISSYAFATSNYLASGGSGFVVLKHNTSQFDTGVQQRDALVDWIRRGRPCLWDSNNGTDDGLFPCSTDDDCHSLDANGNRTDAPDPNQVCACPGHVSPQSDGTCATTGSCNGGGRCVLRDCRDSVAAYHDQTCKSGLTNAHQSQCESELNPCEIGGEECKFLACVDKRVGNFVDNRIIMVGQ